MRRLISLNRAIRRIRHVRARRRRIATGYQRDNAEFLGFGSRSFLSVSDFFFFGHLDKRARENAILPPTVKFAETGWQPAARGRYRSGE